MKVKNITRAVGPWPVRDPFILTAHHYDKYPKGNGHMGPAASLAGRTLGNDFDRNAEWRMYHGETIPGFPHHPHRGFEIVTIIPQGYADHFDSRGSNGRYGEGDVQLMSAGKGVLHGEMFPLIHEDKENPLRLFQIWVNMQGKNKLTEPSYKMLWRDDIPVKRLVNEQGGKVNIKLILGAFDDVNALGPLPYSWAQNLESHIRIALVEMDADTEFHLEAISKTLNRFVFVYEGKDSVRMANQHVGEGFLADLAGDEDILIRSEGQGAKLLILEGEPINEPVAAYGPFVMNTQQELQEAFDEYRRTEFGGWPWGEKESDLVNDKDAGRFASYNKGAEIDRPS